MIFEDNIECLLNRNLDLGKVKFLGLKLGDFIGKIDKSFLAEVGAYPTKWVSTNRNISFRKGETDEVVEILFEKDAVKELSIESTRDILLKFGNPTEIEKKNDWHYYFYLERRIVVSWRDDNQALFGVYLGENIIKPTEYTAHDFLMMYYEFKAMVPNKNHWNTRELRSNPPRYYRLLALQSLMKAFDIGNDLLSDFEHHGFLEKRSELDFEPVYNDIEKYALANESDNSQLTSEIDRIRRIGIKMVYQKFFNFTETMRSTLSFNSGWLATGMITSRYIINKTNQLLNTIDQTKLKEIEDLILLVIDPKRQSFTKGELIRSFNYPDIDLEKINSDHY